MTLPAANAPTPHSPVTTAPEAAVLNNSPPGSRPPGHSRLPKAGQRWSRGVKFGIAGAIILVCVAGASGAWYMLRGLRAAAPTSSITSSITRCCSSPLSSAAHSSRPRTATSSAASRPPPRAAPSPPPSSPSSTTAPMSRRGSSSSSSTTPACKTSCSRIKIDLEKAKADWINATQNYLIQESQNESDIATAKVNLDLAILNLEQYKDGEFLQAKRDIEGRQLMAAFRPRDVGRTLVVVGTDVPARPTLRDGGAGRFRPRPHGQRRNRARARRRGSRVLEEYTARIQHQGARKHHRGSETGPRSRPETSDR